MKPYSVEIFWPDFTMVGNTNVNEVTYKEDYLTSDENTITMLSLPSIEKQNFIRTPAESGGHYNIVNLMDSVIVPAMQKYGILVKAALDDAIIQQTVIATNGIFKGCNVNYARGNVLHVSQASA